MRINIYEILFWIFFMITLVVMLGYIFGESPTIEQALLVLVITFLFRIQANTISNNFELREMKRRYFKFEKSFIKLVKDFREHIKHK